MLLRFTESGGFKLADLSLFSVYYKLKVLRVEAYDIIKSMDTNKCSIKLANKGDKSVIQWILMNWLS